MTKLIDEHLDLEAIEMYTHMINIMHIPCKFNQYIRFLNITTKSHTIL